MEKSKHGMIFLTRLDATGAVLKSERRRYLMYHSDQRTLSYYTDSEMSEHCGSMALRDIQLESNPETANIELVLRNKIDDNKVYRLTDSKNPENVASWLQFLNHVKKQLREPRDYGIKVTDIQGNYTSNVMVRAKRRDEVSQCIEYEIWCHAVFLAKLGGKKMQTRWSVWRSFNDFKDLDTKLKQSLGWQMDQVEFPRERKRDAFLGGPNSRSVQENRIKQLNEYMQKIWSIPNVYEFHRHHGNLDLKEFVAFDLHFGEDAASSLRESPSSLPSNEVQEESFASTLSAPPPKSTSTSGFKSKARKSKLPNEEAKVMALPEVSRDECNDACTEETKPSSSLHSLSYTNASLELVQGSEASTLNQMIMEAIVKAAKGDITLVEEFKLMTRSFGEGVIEAAAYVDYLEQLYGREFTSWIGKDVIHLVPDLQKRHSLHAILTQVSNKEVKTILPNSKSSLQKGEEEEEATMEDRMNEKHGLPDLITDPVKAQALHQRILDAVYLLFQKDINRVEDFQDQTKSFGQGEMSAAEYTAYLQGAIGWEETSLLIHDMLCLLPSLEKRKELMHAQEKALERMHRRKKKRSKQFSRDNWVVAPTETLVAPQAIPHLSPGIISSPPAEPPWTTSTNAKSITPTWHASTSKRQQSSSLKDFSSLEKIQSISISEPRSKEKQPLEVEESERTDKLTTSRSRDASGSFPRQHERKDVKDPSAATTNRTRTVVAGACDEHTTAASLVVEAKMTSHQILKEENPLEYHSQQPKQQQQQQQQQTQEVQVERPRVRKSGKSCTQLSIDVITQDVQGVNLTTTRERTFRSRGSASSMQNLSSVSKSTTLPSSDRICEISSSLDQQQAKPKMLAMNLTPSRSEEMPLMPVSNIEPNKNSSGVNMDENPLLSAATQHAYGGQDFEEEENPVLARLRKQGAVNFFGGLPGH